MEELEIQYSQALAKPKQETILHKSLLETLVFKATRIYQYNPLDNNNNSIFFNTINLNTINDCSIADVAISTTNLVHRWNITVHM